jgi:hypothetical protein
VVLSNAIQQMSICLILESKNLNMLQGGKCSHRFVERCHIYPLMNDILLVRCFLFVQARVSVGQVTLKLLKELIYPFSTYLTLAGSLMLSSRQNLRQSGELMTYPQVGETFTYSTEACDIVRLIGLRWLWSSEALDRQVGSLINVDDLVRIGLNVI